jgi:hypothetical protein
MKIGHTFLNGAYALFFYFIKRSYHPSQAILLLSKPQSGLKEGPNAANLLRRFALMKM